MMRYAPVILFAYNRPAHTLEVLKSLKRNAEAPSCDLIVFIDGLREDHTEAEKSRRDEVIAIVESEKWCGNVRVHITGKNKGLSASVTEGVSRILQEYDRVIVLEDDLVCDGYFLSFMNQALDLYGDDEDVACVSGYIYPLNTHLPQSFFIKGADCWGWATWKRAWSIYDPDGKALLDAIRSEKRENEFNFNGAYPYTEMLADQIAGRNNSWAIRWYASAFLKNKLCLYPAHSFVKNIGNDASGTHAGATDKFDVTLQNKSIQLAKIHKNVNQGAYNAITAYFLEAFPTDKGTEESLLKKIYRKILPASLRNWIYKKRQPAAEQKWGWSGKYSSWTQAQKECSGYDQENIFERVKAATLQVKAGKAVFERDSILFYKPEYNADFLKTLDLIAADNNNSLSIVDFGGSLGSVYHQYKSQLEKFEKVRWCIVEQAHFVEFGKRELETAQLKFCHTIKDCLRDQPANAILLSSVISYLENPYETLKRILENDFEYVIIDKTIFTNYKSDLLTKQVVPEAIYQASYPCWVLNLDKLVTFMSGHYKLQMAFDPYQNDEVLIDGKKAFFRALVFKKK
jgi:putative methyltransferase (TIGR04325 family)